MPTNHASLLVSGTARVLEDDVLPFGCSVNVVCTSTFSSIHILNSSIPSFDYDVGSWLASGNEQPAVSRLASGICTSIPVANRAYFCPMHVCPEGTRRVRRVDSLPRPPRTRDIGTDDIRRRKVDRQRARSALCVYS